MAMQRFVQLTEQIDQLQRDILMCATLGQMETLEPILEKQAVLLAELMGLSVRAVDKPRLVEYLKDVLKQHRMLKAEVQDELDKVRTSLLRCRDLKAYLL